MAAAAHSLPTANTNPKTARDAKLAFAHRILSLSQPAPLAASVSFVADDTKLFDCEAIRGSYDSRRKLITPLPDLRCRGLQLKRDGPFNLTMSVADPFRSFIAGTPYSPEWTLYQPLAASLLPPPTDKSKVSVPTLPNVSAWMLSSYSVRNSQVTVLRVSTPSPDAPMMEFLFRSHSGLVSRRHLCRSAEERTLNLVMTVRSDGSIDSEIDSGSAESCRHCSLLRFLDAQIISPSAEDQTRAEPSAVSLAMQLLAENASLISVTIELLHSERSSSVTRSRVVFATHLAGHFIPIQLIKLPKHLASQFLATDLSAAFTNENHAQLVSSLLGKLDVLDELAAAVGPSLAELDGRLSELRTECRNVYGFSLAEDGKQEIDDRPSFSPFALIAHRPADEADSNLFYRSLQALMRLLAQHSALINIRLRLTSVSRDSVNDSASHYRLFLLSSDDGMLRTDSPQGVLFSVTPTNVYQARTKIFDSAMIAQVRNALRDAQTAHPLASLQAGVISHLQKAGSALVNWHRFSAPVVTLLHSLQNPRKPFPAIWRDVTLPEPKQTKAHQPARTKRAGAGEPEAQAAFRESYSSAAAAPAAAAATADGGSLSGITMVLLVAMPGGGKSYFCEAFAQKVQSVASAAASPSAGAVPASVSRRWVRVSQDDLGSRARCEQAFSDALTAGANVVVDRTNIDPEQRFHWLRLAQIHNRALLAKQNTKIESALVCAVYCVWLTTPVHECQRRVLRRVDHPTLGANWSSLPVIDTFARGLVPPVVEEGFTHVFEIANNSQIDAAILSILNLQT